MSARYGIDTSILVRLVTGLPLAEFEQTLQTLSNMVEKEGAQLHASAMVIGEAYIALQHQRPSRLGCLAIARHDHVASAGQRVLRPTRRHSNSPKRARI